MRSLRRTRSQTRAGRVVRGAREVLVDEALVVADVEIGLGAVLGHEDLAVLERAHRPRVDVEVRVELLHLHLQPARLQQPAERGGGDALAERRDDAAGDEDVFGAHRPPRSVMKLTGFDRTSAHRPLTRLMLGAASDRRRKAAAPSAFERREELRAAEHALELVAALVVVERLDPRVRRVARHLLDAEVAVGGLAICGRWVIVTTCARSASRRSVSATACAVVPPMPASISSNTIVSPPPRRRSRARCARARRRTPSRRPARTAGRRSAGSGTRPRRRPWRPARARAARPGTRRRPGRSPAARPRRPRRTARRPRAVRRGSSAWSRSTSASRARERLARPPRPGRGPRRARPARGAPPRRASSSSA